MNAKDLISQAKATIDAASKVKSTLKIIDTDIEAADKAIAMVTKAMDEVKGKDVEAYGRGLVLKAQLEGEKAALIAQRHTVDPHSSLNLKEEMGKKAAKAGQNIVVGSAKAGAVLGAFASPANALINSFKAANSIVATTMLETASQEKKSGLVL
jgi:hypothetical protein